MELQKEYHNGDLTIVWKPERCQHAGICVKMLPEVYNPKEKPWIKAENASVEALKDQISKCPSGALTYYMKDDTKTSTATVQVVDNEEKKRFEAEVKGKIAFIEYIRAKGSIYLTHTEVPIELEGNGVGSALVREVLTRIDRSGEKLAPLCPFVAAYMKRHPEWKKLLAEGYNV
ncbi:(4Fe-4S)-binding protein [Sungkyunkwania multivorans]|uniref:(4Fe-4S)-binding protein n=1 Tax=Sungkyunkwania multivorans TaxID=1173618 RepID=A0ABW3D0P7_9FLAO